eukprot:snap_masked-scaffold_28-processed-gene-4.85-mRNA-1 protein AED:1.00 eAED:1.00 QI:0/0/0/0/1/1/3/0/72
MFLAIFHTNLFHIKAKRSQKRKTYYKAENYTDELVDAKQLKYVEKKIKKYSKQNLCAIERKIMKENDDIELK